MHRVLCFGEILWDLLPHGRFLGGAPLNVAYHLVRNGCMAQLVSAVGNDELGDEALARAATTGVAVGTVGRHLSLSTGSATVHREGTGQTRFEISLPAAWDDIPVSTVLDQQQQPAIVFGTLALRSPANRTTLSRLLDAFPHSWIVCDLNLRLPFDDLTPLTHLLRRCHLLKFNADEARRFCPRPIDADWREISADLATRHPGATICLTLGGEGAALREGSLWCTVDAPPIVVRDTIGAGDAFMAALIAGHLRFPEFGWPRVLRAACQLGSFVASHDGSQPDYGDFRVKFD